MNEQEKKEREMRRCERMCGDIFSKTVTSPNVSPEELASRQEKAAHAIDVVHKLKEKNPNL